MRWGGVVVLYLSVVLQRIEKGVGDNGLSWACHTTTQRRGPGLAIVLISVWPSRDQPAGRSISVAWRCRGG